MTTLKEGAGRVLALVLAGAALASCTAHGQGRKLDPRVYVNYTPYSESFYRELMTGRVHLYAPRAGNWRNVVHGQIFASDGTLIECLPGRVEGKLFWFWVERARWSLVKHRSGVRIERDFGNGEKRYWSKFYNPKTGSFTTEYLKKGRWSRGDTGVIQDTWPRVLADGCPNLKPPAHIRINEKQTSPRMDELRRQDPDAAVQNFPGSHLTAPGRTGLGASSGKPTTTREQVWSWLQGQEGYVLTSSDGVGNVVVLAEGGKEHEVWRLADDGSISGIGVLRDEGDWAFVEVPEPSEAVKYPVGYPVPLLPTGHRHPAFQLTGELVAVPEPVALAFMGEAYADKRFVFYGTGRVAVVDLVGELIVEGSWRWTRGRLEVAVDGDGAGARSVGWRELAGQLGKTPAVWKPSSATAG